MCLRTGRERRARKVEQRTSSIQVRQLVPLLWSLPSSSSFSLIISLLLRKYYYKGILY